MASQVEAPEVSSELESYWFKRRKALRPVWDALGGPAPLPSGGLNIPRGRALTRLFENDSAPHGSPAPHSQHTPATISCQKEAIWGGDVLFVLGNWAFWWSPHCLSIHFTTLPGCPLPLRFPNLHSCWIAWAPAGLPFLPGQRGRCPSACTPLWVAMNVTSPSWEPGPIFYFSWSPSTQAGKPTRHYLSLLSQRRKGFIL